VADAAQSRQLASAGWALVRVGNPRGAVRQFKDALAADPENADALAGLAQSYLNLGELKEADQPIDALLRLAPNGATGHRLRAETLRRRKAFKKATETARQAVALDPREPLGYHILALCHVGQKNYKAALKVCDEGLAITPGSSVLHAQRGDILLELRGPKAAAPSSDTALGLAPDSPYVLRGAARIALARNDVARAHDLLGAVLRRNANDRDAVALYLLTDPKRRRVLRALFVFRYWRKPRGVLGAALWFGVWFTVIAAAILIAIVSRIPGILVCVVLAARFFLRYQYSAHEKAVQAHFKTFSLNKGF
jgi:tetratricopeptide (TPR) repeat protein